MKAIRIKSWDRHYENNRSRELKRPEWLPLPNKFDGTGFMELLDHPAGMSHYGAWCLLLGAASRMPVRGLLVTDSGRTMTAKDLARMTRGSTRCFEEALPRLIAIGWVEEVEHVSQCNSNDNAQPVASGADADGQDGAEKSQPSAGIPQRGATLVRLKEKEKEKEKEKTPEARACEPARLTTADGLDEYDLTSPSPPRTEPASGNDEDLWRYQIGAQPWVRTLKSVGCKIGPKNWRTWRGLIDRVFDGDPGRAVAAAAQVAPADRWPDQVEAATKPAATAHVAEKYGPKPEAVTL